MPVCPVWPPSQRALQRRQVPHADLRQVDAEGRRPSFLLQGIHSPHSSPRALDERASAGYQVPNGVTAALP